MKLNWFKSRPYNGNTIKIDKSKTFRFKRSFVQSKGFTQQTLFMIGYDEDELPINHLYFVEINQNTDDSKAFKLTSRKNGWSVSGKGIVNLLNIKVPIDCDVEDYDKDGIKGFRLVLNKEQKQQINKEGSEKSNTKILKDTLPPPPPPAPIEKTFKERTYKKIICEDCGKDFIPSSPRGKVCGDCKTSDVPKKIIEKQEFPKVDKVRILPSGVMGDDLVGYKQGVNSKDL
jgi:hypothetical protein